MTNEIESKSKDNIITVIWRNKDKKSTWIILLIILLIIIVSVSLVVNKVEKATNKPKIITSSSLEKMIDISELSTYEMLYSGVVEMRNKKKKNKVDFYVKYDATVKVGIDTSDIKVTVDEKNEKVIVKLPEVKINNVELNHKELKTMFINDKADDISKFPDIYTICKKDAKKEAKKSSAIYKMAKDNAQNYIKALVNPIIDEYNEQFDMNYKISMK